MGVLEALRIALDMIRAHKLRAFFTVLGTVVGVTFLIAVITILEGMNAYMREDFAGKIFGFNTVMVRPSPMDRSPADQAELREWQRRPQLKVDDAEYLAERLETPGVLSYSTETAAPIGNATGKSVRNARVTGASATFFRIRELELEEGRPFSENEAARGVPVVVLGKDVADRLFPDASPLGRDIRIAGFPYRVVGVLAPQGNVFGQSIDNFVVAPFRAPVNGQLWPHDMTADISFKVPDAALLPVAVAEVEGLMRIRRRLRPGEANSFEVETSESAIAFWNQISAFLIAALPMLVGISLIVGAVVIMNLMLVSVTERTREIGIRKSLGARRKDVLMQFLIEAATLSGAGGVLGIGLGVALASLVSSISPMPARVAPWSMGLAIALGVGVGLVAGVYPAYRAAQLDPIVALRKE